MFSYADLVLYDRLGRLVAAAEIKNMRGTSGDWAAKLRRNILAHGEFPPVDFYLIVTPDRLYLWKGAGNEPIVIQPAYEADARPIFKPYFDRARLTPAEVSGMAFELIVASWLGDLIRLDEQAQELANDERWLVESGLLDAIKDGRIGYEVAT